MTLGAMPTIEPKTKRLDKKSWVLEFGYGFPNIVWLSAFSLHYPGYGSIAHSTNEQYYKTEDGWPLRHDHNHDHTQQAGNPVLQRENRAQSKETELRKKKFLYDCSDDNGGVILNHVDACASKCSYCYVASQMLKAGKPYSKISNPFFCI